ncbi:MAG: hypothetical protein KDA89_14305 [Planctomycetaceae bacterium]|nr:hypothetical protein [Planctomycetaceae bacterium]
MNVLGLDIGGANIKAADSDGNSASASFPIWKDRDGLTAVLRRLADTFPARPDIVALTMTAELADCFATKSEGVEFIVAAVEQLFTGSLVRVWLTSGEFAAPDDAREVPELIAAANWHALATWAARTVPSGRAVLIDCGSTTTDIIPLLDGAAVPAGLNDRERLVSGELVYTGWLRTPVCAMVSHVPLRGQDCPVAAELFATAADAWLVADRIRDRPDLIQTADGRPLVKTYSETRLAHTVCCDATELSTEEIREIGEFVTERQCRQIADAVRRVTDRLSALTDDQTLPPTVLISGSGAFIVDRVLDEYLPQLFSPRLKLSAMFRHSVTDCACAFAVARLAHEMCSDDLLETALF